MEEGDEFSCDTCPVRDQFAALDEPNFRAWLLYPEVCSRFAFETHTCGLVLARATAQDDDDTVRDLLARLGVLFRIWNPVKRTRHGT